MVSIAKYRLTDHVKLEIKRRSIAEAEIAQVLAKPEQVEMIRAGRAVYQSKFEFGETSKTYLLRVFVDIDRQPPEIVTAYRTSKIDKYWKEAQ